MTARPLNRGVRYLGVSAICVVFNNLLLIALDAAGASYTLAVSASVAVMIPIGFALQARVTFACPSSWAAFRRYALVMLVNLPGAWLLFALVKGWAGLPMSVAAPMVTAITFLWNFAGSHWALFRRGCPAA